MCKGGLPIEIYLHICSYVKECPLCKRYKTNNCVYCDQKCYFNYKKKYIASFNVILLFVITSYIYGNEIITFSLLMLLIVFTESLF